MPQKLNTRSESLSENLLAGAIEMPTGTVTLKKGFAYKRGHVLGFIATEEKCTPVNKAKTDNSQLVYAIAAEDADATDSDVVAAIYMAGEFISSQLIFEGGDTAADHQLSARQVGIFFK
ncbi:MAG: head decoration protein [Burkholderiales bacterium]|nr:head decoration protein [Burkholderiales bacterium]